jgi:predicted RND superfamily exporter protein
VTRAADFLQRLALERGGLVLAVALALSTPLAVGYLRLPWTQDPEVITLQGSDALEHYREYVRRWGSDKWIVLAYEVDDAFAPERLAELRTLGDELFAIEGVRDVSSLDTAFVVDTGPFGPFARPLVPEQIGVDPQIRRRALESSFTRDALVSADGRVLTLGVQLEESDLDSTQAEARVLGAIEAILAQPRFSGLDVHLAGAPVFSRELSRLNQRDQARFVPLTIAVIALFLFVLLRSALATALALGMLLLTVVWTLGAMSWLGIPLNITTGLLPPLLMVVTIAESVHLLSAYIERLREGATRPSALGFMLGEVLPSCAWTTLTTAVGFASLLLVRIESVRLFALFAVLGIGISLLLLSLVLPAALVRLPIAAPRAGAARAWRLGFVRSAARRPAIAIGLLAGSLALAAVGLPRIDVSTHDGEFFAPSNPLNRAYRFIEARMQGVTPLEVEIRAPQAGAFRRPEAIRRLAALQRALAGHAKVAPGTSLADLLLATSPGLELGDDAAVERGLFLLAALAGEEVERFVKEDGRLARISARTKAMSSAENEALLAALDGQAAEIFPAGWQVRFTGLVPVFSQMEQYLVDGQVQSYGAAVLAVALIFTALFRSGVIVAAALIANTAPILATLGIMGILGIRLDVATIMVACIAEGIIVDDTIHLVHSFLRMWRQCGDRGKALDHALEVSGRPIVITAAILAAGFAIPMLSDFQPTAHFGMLVGLAVLAALAAELFILPPALLRVPGGLGR